MPPACRTRDFRAGSLGLALGALILSLGLAAQAQAAGQIRLAVLAYGTSGWELDSIRRHGLDRAEGLELDVKSYAGAQATLVALQSGAADLAINDWIWVARQRAEGRPFAFVPYSTALGALMVPAGLESGGLGGLKGRRLGVAGGPLDKSWLLLRALAIRQGDGDPESFAEPIYGAPPLLSEQLKQGRVDGVLTYWHYAARLEAAGYKPLARMGEVRRALGIEAEVPMVGYCFDADWADANRDTLLGFFRAVQRARAILKESDTEWELLRPLMGAPDQATFVALRDGYRAGIPERWGPTEREGAARLFEILRELGGSRLTGDATRLPEGTFWNGLPDWGQVAERSASSGPVAETRERPGENP